MRIFKWLYPGMKIKRWVFLFGLGIILAVAAAAVFLLERSPAVRNVCIGIFILAGFVLILSVRRLIGSIITIFLPQQEKELVEILFKKRYLQRGPKVVTIGGGSGLSVLLQGLKECTSNITAIVTVADDGGSSGRIRQQFDILPPGDIRNCLVALADAPTLMRDLFQFRFAKDSDMGEHNFGNLFITVMTKLTGDFEKAIKESSRVLAIRGQVIPSTLENVCLSAEYKDGTSADGEATIPQRHTPIKSVYLTPAHPPGTPDAIKAIQEADIIVVGPGSLYTSIIPNFLVKDITDAVSQAKVPKVYVCNVMTQFGETDGYSAYDHIKTLIDHSNPKIITHCIVNVTRVPEELLFKYRQENSYPIRNDSERIRKLGYRVLEDRIITTGDVVRHDSAAISRIIVRLARQESELRFALD